jgi:predicted phage terminase large subunit-like protein
VAGKTALAPYLDLRAIHAEKAERCKKSFAYFLRQAWHVIEPARPLIWGMHTDACSQHLQAIGDGLLHRLVVNIAPGHGKSSIFSVAFPAWIWTRNPHERFLCASYAMDLAIRDNRNCRMLIESEWYQSLFSDVFQMSGDQNVKSFWENDKRGYRLATAVRGAGTGKRGTMLIIDDPNNAMAGVAEIEAVREWFGRTWQGRLNNQESGAMITVGQRLSEKDLTSHLLRLGGWEHCNLPTEYEPDRKSHTSIGWSDPRTVEGELLCPELLSAQSIQDLKHSIGSMNYASQYQQSPVPADGGTFKKQWIRYFTETPDAYVLQKTNGSTSILKSACWRFTVVDLAISSKQTADYTVIQTYDVTPHKDLILIDQIRDRMDNPEQLKTLKMVHARLRPMYMKVESIAYQLAIVQQLKQLAIPVREYRPTRDKVSRASVAAILMENEKFFFRQGDPYLLVLEPELLMFPLGAHDDQVDDLSAAGDEVGMPHPTGGVYIPTAADLVGDDGEENMSLLEDDRRW